MTLKDLHIYNSLSNSKEKFKSIEKGSIGMYVCGPTVYSDVHLGNCRTFISFDVIYRYFIHLGYKVRYVRNITDVDDKIIEASNKNNESIKSLTTIIIKYFHEDLKYLNCLVGPIPRLFIHTFSTELEFYTIKLFRMNNK